LRNCNIQSLSLQKALFSAPHLTFPDLAFPRSISLLPNITPIIGELQNHFAAKQQL
jgi:hypothetical protein